MSYQRIDEGVWNVSFTGPFQARFGNHELERCLDELLTYVPHAAGERDALRIRLLRAPCTVIAGETASNSGAPGAHPPLGWGAADGPGSSMLVAQTCVDGNALVLAPQYASAGPLSVPTYISQVGGARYYLLAPTKDTPLLGLVGSVRAALDHRGPSPVNHRMRERVLAWAASDAGSVTHQQLIPHGPYIPLTGGYGGVRFKPRTSAPVVFASRDANPPGVSTLDLAVWLREHGYPEVWRAVQAFLQRRKEERAGEHTV